MLTHDPFESSGSYDVAQVCLNGHVINDSFKSFPAQNQKFCGKCGAPTITDCEHCKSFIRGSYSAPGIFNSRYDAGFCHNCGEPYPWTESRLKAARELAQEGEKLSKDEREQLTKSFDELVRDTPSTGLSAMRFKKIIAKVGGPSAEAFKTILVDIATETAKRLLWPK